jgi:cytochrome bd-type quinol oxidase subunit 2
MGEHNTSLIVMMVVAIVLLFTSMVLSSMASNATEGCTDENAHKYSMYSAIVSGIAVFLIGIALWFYIYREPLMSGVGDTLTSAGKSLKVKTP